MEEVIEELKKVHPHGLEIASRIGILSHSLEIFRDGRRYFVFDATCLEWDFDPANGYMRRRLLELFADGWYQIDGAAYLGWVWDGGKYEPYPPLKKPYTPP